MTNIRLSIITINYNNESGLNKTMESVMRQTYNFIEHIIIDGGSIDLSVNIIKKYEDKITYWVSEKDKGVYHAQNKGVLNCRGDYLLFLNSGDYLINDEIISKAIEKFADEEIIYGDLYLNYNDKNITLKNYPSKLSFDYFFHDESLPHPSTFIRKSLFSKIGLYNEKFEIVSDWEFWLKAIFLHQASYKKIPFPISIYDMNGVSSRLENRNKIKFEKNEVYGNYFRGIIDDYKKYNYVIEKINTNRLIRILRKYKIIQ